MNSRTGMDFVRWRPGVALSALLLASTVALGEEETETAEATPIVAEEIVVSANRYEAPRSQVGSAVTVIGAEEIERRNQVAVLDLLRTVPGVEVTQTGGPGKAATVRVRGGGGAQAAVLIDGIRVNSVTGGSFDFSNLLASNVERIEVLRGPQATFGSEAMTGVISITTSRGEPGWRLNATAEAGSNEHQRFDFGFLGGTGVWDYSVSGTDLSTDAVSHRYIEGQSLEDDPFENQTLSARLGAAFLEDGRVDLRARSARGDTALDGFGAEDLNAMSAKDDETLALTVEKALGSIWRQTLRVGRTEGLLRGTDPDTRWNNYEVNSRIQQVELQSDVTLGADHLLNLGYSSETREGISMGNFEEEADLDAWFVQDQWSITDNVHVTAAVRGDDHSAFGSETSHRVTLSSSWLEGRSRLHGSYGTAFRAPTFNELYYPGSGDPNLLPETTEGFDIGLEQRFGESGVSFDLTWFDMEFDQLIQFYFPTFSFRNVAQASSSGAEFTLRYRASVDYSVELSHTYNDTEDGATGEPLARRPKNRTTLVAQLRPTERFSAAVMAAVVSDRINSNGAVMDDYTKVDLNLSYTRSLWQPFVRVENALDEDYFEVPGYVTPGRTVVVGVRFQRR